MVKKRKECSLHFSNPIIFAAVICAVLLYSGAAQVKRGGTFISLFNTSEIVCITGKVSSNPLKNAAKGTYSFDFYPAMCFTRKNASSSCKGSIRVLLPAAAVEAFFPGKLYSAATPFSNGEGILCENGVNLSLHGKFTMQGDLFVSSSAKALGWDDNLLGKLAHFRAVCRLQFRRLMYFWGDAGGLFLALLSGIKEYTDKTISDSFRNAGLSHILALSGMHLSLFSSLSKKISTRLAGKKVSLLFQLLSICIFVWFAGFSPSLFRAFLCSVIFLVADFVNYKALKMPQVLSLSFLLHIIIFPNDIFSAAFKLSYGALAGILAFGEFFTAVFIRFIPPGISSSLGASIGAQTFTAPISARLFNVITPIGIVSSIIVSPLITIFIYTGLFLIILSLCVPFFEPTASFFMKIVYSVIARLVLFFSKFPALSF